MGTIDTDSPEGGIPLAGGHLLAAISTRIVGILRDHYGRGPMKAKTYALDDIIVVVMRGSGFTPLEQTIMDSGEPDRVIAMREDFQRVMAERYKQTIEGADRPQRRRVSQPGARRAGHHDGDLLRRRPARRLRRGRGDRAGVGRRSRLSTGQSRSIRLGSSILATWRSGYAAACKAVYTGSTPVVASMRTASKSACFRPEAPEPRTPRRPRLPIGSP